MKTTVVVTLEIECEKEIDAIHVVDGALDAGFFQDGINDHDMEDCGPVHVVSAIVRKA